MPPSVQLIGLDVILFFFLMFHSLVSFHCLNRSFCFIHSSNVKTPLPIFCYIHRLNNTTRKYYSSSTHGKSSISSSCNLPQSTTSRIHDHRSSIIVAIPTIHIHVITSRFLLFQNQNNHASLIIGLTRLGSPSQ